MSTQAHLQGELLKRCLKADAYSCGSSNRCDWTAVLPVLQMRRCGGGNIHFDQVTLPDRSAKGSGWKPPNKINEIKTHKKGKVCPPQPRSC